MRSAAALLGMAWRQFLTVVTFRRRAPPCHNTAGRGEVARGPVHGGWIVLSLAGWAVSRVLVRTLFQGSWNSNRMRNAFCVTMVALCAACAAPVPVPSPVAGDVPADFPESYYRQIAAQGTRVFEVDPAASKIVIEVYRGGSLARLGHDHVVASHDVQGFVAPGAGRADLYVRADRLIVDEPGLRAEAKFETQPTDEDIAGTRRNMLNALEASRYPFILLSVAGAGSRTEAGLRVSLTVRGVAREIQVPVQIDSNAVAFTVTGRMALKQTDFGITPLSVLGGAIRVQDEVSVRFRIRARPID